MINLIKMKLCADAVFLEGHSIKCDESSITGESDPVRKGTIENNLDPFFISGSQVLLITNNNF